MKQKDRHVVVDKIVDSLGLCRQCRFVDFVPKEKVTYRSKIYKSMSCNAQAIKMACYQVRTNLYECTLFSPIKPKSNLESIISLLKALIACSKAKSWEPLKEAVRNELKD